MALPLRVLAVTALGVFFLSTGTPQPPQPPQKSLTDRYCISCHSEKTKAGGLVLSTIAGQPATAHSDAWEKVIRRLRARSMPPAGLPRPDEAGYTAAIASLESALDRQYAAKPNPGRTDTFRRLNRTEYHNSIRDLLALDVDVTTLLPGDDSSHGFDNITVGELSPTLLERYLAAAQKISRLALGSPVKAVGGETILLPPDLTQEDHFDELPLGTRGGAVTRYTFPRDADYEITLRLARDRNETVEGLKGVHQLELTLDGERLQVFTVQPPPKGEDHSKVDAGLHVRIPVKAGAHELAAAFLKKPTTLLETDRQPYQAHFNMDRHPRIQPALYSLSIVGPFNPQGPGETASRRRIFVCGTEDDACARQIVRTLARRAWRSPVTDADIAVPCAFTRKPGPAALKPASKWPCAPSWSAPGSSSASNRTPPEPHPEPPIS